MMEINANQNYVKRKCLMHMDLKQNFDFIVNRELKGAYGGYMD